MTLDEIETFLCVNEFGSFSKAATMLHRTQPAISRRVQLLEESLGTPLFSRQGKSVRLNAAGQAFIPHAEAIVASVRDGKRAVSALTDPKLANASFSLAIVGTLADSYLVEALRHFEALEPGSRVSIRTANSKEVSELVRRGECELGLRYFTDRNPKLNSQILGQEKLYVVAPASHPMCGKRLRDLSALADENWLGFKQDRSQPESLGYLLERELMSAGLIDTKITAVDSLTAQKRLIQAGYGITLMPLNSVREELDSGSLQVIEVAKLRAEMPVVAIRRVQGHRAVGVDLFLRLLDEHMHFGGR